MKHRVTLFFVAFCLLCNMAQGQKSDCFGRRRWDLKVLTDSRTKDINFTPADTTIKALLTIVPAYRIMHSTPRFGPEFRTFRVRCRVKEWMSKSDGDYHLVLMDAGDTTKILIGEIPDPDCGEARNSAYAETFRALRKQVDGLQTSNRHLQEGIYTITGVAFFDKVHERFEVASNGIELHPILSIKKD